MIRCLVRRQQGSNVKEFVWWILRVLRYRRANVRAAGNWGSLSIIKLMEFRLPPLLNSPDCSTPE
jgi:hypothetical protein